MRLTTSILTLRRDEPLVAHERTTATAVQLLVRAEYDGRTGLGTAPVAPPHAENASRLRACIDGWAASLGAATPFELESVLRRCEATPGAESAALSALDMAFHDLLGQAAGLALHRLWGLDGLLVPPTAVSLGVMADDERVSRARELAGWPILKLKMTAATSLRVVARVREVYDGRLWVDGNGCWDAARAAEAAEELHDCGVELLEQPIPAGDLDGLRRVRERSPLPIVADEDCRAPEDVLRLRGCADVVNVKLAKCGGLRRAAEMVRSARRAGLDVMLGCKVESVVGVTAMAHLAGLADFLDLDGHLALADDPFEGVVVDRGRVVLPQGPGLGVSVRRR